MMHFKPEPKAARLAGGSAGRVAQVQKHCSKNMFCWDGSPDNKENLKVDDLPECPKGRVCLKDPNTPLCPVEHCVMHKLIYIKCVGELDCLYKLELDGAAICTCPVRKQIYNRTGR